MTISRLSALDLMFLRLETPAWPCHYGGLAVVDGTPLLDRSGRVDLDSIRKRFDRRLADAPQLRRRLHRPGLLQGRPLWVDDEHFDIRHHVRSVEVAPPGGDAELFAAVDRVYGGLMDRSRPLWELWVLTGLAGGRVGLLLKLHHSVADGLAAVGVIAALVDGEPDQADPPDVVWATQPPPAAWSLVADNVAVKLHTLRRVASAAAHPRELARRVRFGAVVLRRYLGSQPAPRTSLNQPVRAGRRIRSLRLELDAMKTVAHAHDGKLNDVVLSLWTGGLRHLMQSRGEAVAGVALKGGMPVSLRAGRDGGAVNNQVGALVLPLPVSQPDPARRLDAIVATTRQTKAEQLPAAVMAPLVALAATPMGRYFTSHQRANNVLVTNVMGPPQPVYLLGARVLEILPVIELVGNIGLTLCAFSYAGRVSLVVTADAMAFPDLDVLMTGMQQEWEALASSGAVADHAAV